MTAEAAPTEPATEGDFTPRQLRILKAAVVIMAVILVVGFAVLLGTIVYQTTQLAESGAGGQAPMANFDVIVGPDRKVEQIALDGNRAALHLRGPEGPELAIVDTHQRQDRQPATPQARIDLIAPRRSLYSFITHSDAPIV